MLGKLIKQEWKATIRILLPLYMILVCTTLITSLLAHWDNDFSNLITGLSTFTYGISLVLIAAGTTLLLYVRFYKNLLTDEGYLMFTLPVKTSDLVLSKLVISCFHTIASIIAVILSLLALAYASGHHDTVSAVINLFREELVHESGLAEPLLLIIAAVLVILSIVSSIVLVYFAIALGQLFTSHRIIGAFVSYGAIYVVMELLLFAMMMVFVLINGPGYIDAPDFALFLGMTIFIFILTAACYLGTINVLKKKLNLE